MKYSYNDIMEPWYPEEFKIINAYDIKLNTYAISNYGRVMNINTKRILSTISHDGYREVRLYTNDGKYKGYRVHILVALHFIPKTEDDILNDRIYVNHKNLIRGMNYVHNLEWVNMTENNNHSVHYRDKSIKCDVVKRITYGWGDSRNIEGEKSPLARLTNDQVHQICKMLEQKIYTTKDICSAVGLTTSKNDKELIYNIKRHKRWKHISKYYNF